MLVYSDKKIKENLNLLYSVLNPDTNSDSPSEKSNGVRFISAINEINKSKYIIADNIINNLKHWNFKKKLKSKFLVNKIKERKIKTNLTS